MSISMSNITAIIQNFKQFFDSLNLLLILRIVSYIVLGIIITLYICRIIGKISEKHTSKHHSQLLRRITFYIGVALSFIFPLKISGADVTGLLGAAGIAAGILTAAIAFASQTSISNFLSGVFLLVEKPFEVGDLITVNTISGEVLSIDLLSVKICTENNIFVRIPNEVLLKSQFMNLSRFPIRRCDIKLYVSFTQDLPKVKKILMDVARHNPLCLVSPAPEFTFVEFGESAILLQFSVWGKQTSLTDLQTNLPLDIQAAFNTHGIQRAPAF